MISEEGKLLLVDKPLHWTSFDVVKKLKYSLRPKKMGHAGTLDPLATGLLIIGVNKFTKRLSEVQALDKMYEGTIEIGKTTPSYDLETEFDSEMRYDHVTADEIDRARSELTGEIKQRPPDFSAIKVGGQRAYEKARRNEHVEIKSRMITVHRFEIMEARLPIINFRVQCSKGTYIRSLAHDFGQLLGTGAYLKSLRRTAIGEYRIEDAMSIEEVIKTHLHA